MKVLVIGGNRFIGAELVARLRSCGQEVTVVALDAPAPEVRGDVRFVQADRNDHVQMSKELGGSHFDAVFDNIAFKPEHVEGLLRVLDGRCARYVLTSSVDIYPVRVPRQWREEEGVLEPATLEGAPKSEHYRRGKRACETLLRGSGVPFAIVRPAMVVGPRDPIAPRPGLWHEPGSLAARSLHLPARVLDGGPVLLPRSDHRIFQLAWVQDVAHALAIAGLHPLAGGETFNVAGDELWSHERLLHALGDVAGRRVSVVRATGQELRAVGLGGYEPPYGSSTRCSLASNDRLKTFGWRPTPSALWLPQLLEAVRDPQRRPLVSYRAREVALARKVLQQRERVLPEDGSIPAAAAPPPRVTPPSVAPAIHCRLLDGRQVSSIGIGTHRGDTTAATDACYAEALHAALAGGLNLIDTAINYRGMRSERAVGRVVRERTEGGCGRDDLFVVTKGGYVPHDAEDPRPARRWIEEELVQPGLLGAQEAADRHSIRAEWILESLQRSLNNLGLQKIDGYLVHNPELALARLGASFWPELTRTFAALEEAVAAGLIGCYGVALWRTVRTRANDADRLPIERAVRSAQIAAGGGGHHLRLIELPLNVSDPGALLIKNQLAHGRMVCALDAARAHGLYVLTSASVAGGEQLTPRARARLPQQPGVSSERARALQFTRSAPGVGSALVGMRRVEHVREALQLAAQVPLLADQMAQLVPERRSKDPAPY